MQVTAHLRHLHMSPRKVALVAELDRGMDVTEAHAQLAHFRKAAALPIRKLLASAIANAEHNAKLDAKNLYIAAIFVNQGPTLKRMRPRAFGRAATIRKRSSHISIVLGERVPTTASAKKHVAAAMPAPKILADRPRAPKGGHTHAHDAEGKEHLPEGAAEQGKDDVRRMGKHRHQEHQDARSNKRPGGFLKRLVTRKLGEK